MPAPIKPMPVTTCEAIRDGSSDTFFPCSRMKSKPECDNIIKSALPNDTKKWVLKPASFARYSRSKPIAPPNMPAIKILSAKSMSIIA